MTDDRILAFPRRLLTGIVGLCLSVPQAAFAYPAVREYDEDLVAANSVDFTASGSAMTAAEFSDIVALAYDRDQGGVLDGNAVSGTSGSAEFGVSQTRGINFDVPTNWAIGSPGFGPDALPISGIGAWAASPQSGNPPRVVFEFPNAITGGLPNERLAQLGVTVLSRATPGIGSASGQVNFSGGGMQLLTANIPLGAGSGDTFFGFMAPAGQWITRLELKAAGGNLMWYDDLGFVTTAFVPEPGALPLASFALMPVIRRRRRS